MQATAIKNLKKEGVISNGKFRIIRKQNDEEIFLFILIIIKLILEQKVNY